MDRQNMDNRKDIPPRRKLLYYLGMTLMVMGIVSFLSVFVNGLRAMNQPFNMEGPSFMAGGLVGFVLILVGAVLRTVGARGLAGSGFKLNPKQAREDLAPYADALGGMARDAVEGFKEAARSDDKAAQQIIIHCPACKALNREDAKYCDQCGQIIG